MDKIIASNGFNIDSIRVQIEQEVSKLSDSDILILLDNLATVKFVNSASFYVFLLQNRKEKFILNKILYQFDRMPHDIRNELYPHMINNIIIQSDGLHFSNKFMEHINKEKDEGGLRQYSMRIKYDELVHFIIKLIVKNYNTGVTSYIDCADMLKLIHVEYDITDNIIGYLKNNDVPDEIVAMLIINYCKHITEHDILVLGYSMKHKPEVLELLKSLLSTLIKNYPEYTIRYNIINVYNKFGLEYLSYMYNHNIFEYLDKAVLKDYLKDKYTINPNDTIVRYIMDNNMHYLFQENGLINKLISRRQYNALRLIQA